MAATALVLIRHGETAWNEAGLYQGHLDSPLTPRGEAQARAVGEALSTERFAAFYSSDLGRAQRTAAIISNRIGQRFLTDPRLREQHYGLIQGHSQKRARELDPGYFESLDLGNPDRAPRGGESRRKRHERSIGALENIAHRHQGDQVLVVAHGGSLDSLFRETLGIGLSGPQRYSVYNAAVNRFSWMEGQWTLHTWGDVSHLASAGMADSGDSSNVPKVF